MFKRGNPRSGLKARTRGALVVALGLVAGVTSVAAEIATPGTSAPVQAAGSLIDDDFSTNDYSGGTPVGAHSWSGPWNETNDAGTPDFSTGFITGDSGALRLADLDNNSRSVQRSVDLSGFTAGATLSFTVNSRVGNEGLEVEFRTGDGAGDFTQLTRFPFTNTVPPANTRYTFVLDDVMIRQNGEVRFRGFEEWEDNDVWVIDDIVIDNPVPNPDLANSCGTELTVVLDESGSIEDPGAAVTLVEDAVYALAQGLVGTGSTLRIVEFSTDARDAQIPAGTPTAQDVTQTYVDGDLDTYLRAPNTVGASLPTDYEPNNANGLTQTFTNWEAGLFRAGDLPPTNADVTPLVFFITDGDPNTIGTTGSSTQANLGGTGEAFNVAAAAASYQEAAALKAAGAHVIGVGVGRAATNAPSFARLTEIVESQDPEIWTNAPGEDLNIQTVDAIQVNTFDALAAALRQAVSELCSQSLDITKVDQNGEPIVGRSFTTTVTGNPGADAFDFLDPAGPAQSATVITDATGDASFQWSPVGKVDDPNAWTSTATFTEQLPPGWTLPAVPGTCTVSPGGTDVGLAASVDGNGLATFTVDHTFRAGETVSCRVVNNEPGTIEVEKTTDPATTELFTFTPGGWNNDESFQLTDGGTFTSGDLAAGGDYTVAETDLPDGWALLPNAVCTTPGEADSPIDSILVVPGTTTTCTFNNREAATLTVEKETLPDGDPTLFTFTPGGWNNDEAFALADGGSKTSGALSPGTYTIAETVPSLWDLTSVSCPDADPDTPGTQVILAAGDDVTCTFTNTEKGQLTIDKLMVDADQPVSTGGDGFTVSYLIDVKNPGPGTNTYDLADTPKFGDGTTITSFEVKNPGAGDFTTVTPNAGVYTLATNDTIAGGTPATPVSERYDVKVTFTVAADMASTERTCDGGSLQNGQGTFNSATITFTGGRATDTDCADIPPGLTITKTLADANQPVSTGGNGFTVSYDIDVTNPGPGPGTYTLTDTPRFGDGTTITDVTATGPDGDITFGPPVNGVYTLTTGNSIAAGSTETYGVTIAFTVAADMASTERTCDGGSLQNGQGTFNSATITFTGGRATDTDCADIPDPEISITKTVTSEPIPYGDGSSTVEYTIDVINTADAGPGVYDLADQPVFSQGIVIESKSVSNTLPGTITTDPTFDVTGEVVTAQSIGSNTTHRYVVTVTLTTAFSPELTYVECKPDGFGPNEGLYNEATVTVNGVTTSADDCADLPGDLELDKDDGGATVIAGGAPFAYTLTVTNVGGISTGEPVTVTDELPVEFEWASFPDIAGTLPFCVQDTTDPQALTCTIDPTLVDLGGESTSFTVLARALGSTTPSELGYENLSDVDSELDPAPQNPACPAVDEQNGLQADALRFLANPAQFLSLALLGGDPSNNVACDRTPVIDGAIQVTKTDDVADSDLVINGQTFTYTLNVTNVGAWPVDDVTLADDLPADIELVSVDAGSGWTCNDVDPIACDFAGELAVGSTTTDVVLTVKVSDAFVGTQIDNQVTSTAIVRTDTDSKTVTDTDTEVTPLEPTLDVGGFVPVCVADAPVIQYTIVPKGFVPGDDTATLQVLDANGNPVDYNGDGVVNNDDLLVDQPLAGTILWPGAEVVDGVTVDWPGWRLVNGLWEIDPTDDFLRDGVKIAVSVNPEATTDLITYPPSNSACADPEQTSADLQIVKTASADIVNQGEAVSFDLVVTNNGPDEATDVVVTDNVPVELDLIGVTSSDFTCSFTDNAVRCSRSSLAVGDSGTIAVQAIVNAGTIGLVSNTATVTGRQLDPEPSNNRFTDSIDVPEVSIDPPVPHPALPDTGSDSDSLLLIAMTLLLAGLALVVVTGKRRRQPVWPPPSIES